jgi:opacity protein-like surface antigen
MTAKIRLLAAAAAVTMATAGTASAQGLLGGGGFYVKGFGGATWPQNDDFDLDSRTGGGSTGSGLDFDTGYVLGIAGGMNVTPNIAVELEYAYRNADGTLTDTPAGDVGGTTESNAWMVNGIYKFQGMGPNAAFAPYAGIGLGAADLNVESGDDLGGDFDSDYNFAYQVITGVAYNVNPNFAIVGEARFFGINDQTLENDDFSFKSTYQTFDFLVGATYSF